MCAVPSTSFSISLQQTVLLLLYGKTLATYMLITSLLKPKALTLIDQENLTGISSFIYLLLKTCNVPNNNFLPLN